MDQVGEVINNILFESGFLIVMCWVKLGSRASGRSGGIRDGMCDVMGIGGFFE